MVRKFALLLCVAVLAALLPAVPARAGTEQDSEGMSARHVSDYTYSNTVDRHAGMDGAQWFIQYTPEFKYQYEWWIFKFGKEEEYRSWDIHEMYYSFDLHNEYEGSASVGWNTTDLKVTFDYVYTSSDSAGRKLTSTSSFVYDLKDYTKGDNIFDFVFDYSDILSGSEHYMKGLPTVVASVSVTVFSPIFNLCGTSVVYSFDYEDGNVVNSICTGISHSTYNPVSGLVFRSDTVDFFRNSDTDRIYVMYTVLPGSTVENMLTVLSVVREFLVSFPKMLLDFLTNMLQFLLVDIPVYFAMLFPFFPNYIVDGFVYFLYFVFLLSLYRLVKGG